MIAPRRTALRDLVWTVVRTDFKVRYHGTLGGFAWALAKPAALFAVLMTVFSFVFQRDNDYTLNLLVGLFLWEFFSESTKVGLLALQAKGFLLTKSRFPRWILPATAISNPLFTLVVVSTALLGYLAALGRMPGPSALLLYAIYVGLLAATVVGFSLAASVLFLRFRDLNQVWEVVLLAGFFVAPIVYPLQILPEGLQRLILLWPPAAAVELARAALLGRGMAPLSEHVPLVACAALSMAVGVALFQRLSPSAAEHL